MLASVPNPLRWERTIRGRIKWFWVWRGILLAAGFTAPGLILQGNLLRIWGGNVAPWQSLPIFTFLFVGLLVAASLLAIPIAKSTGLSGRLCLLGIAGFSIISAATIFDSSAGMTARAFTAMSSFDILAGLVCALVFKDARAACLSMLFLCIATVALEWVLLLAGVDRFRSGGSFRATAGMGNPLDLATLLGVCVSALTGWLAFSKETSRLGLAAIVWISIGLVCTVSRNATISATVVAVVVLLLARRRAAVVVISAAAGIALVAMTSLLRSAGAGTASLGRSDTGRLALAREAWNYFARNPWIGYGPGWADAQLNGAQVFRSAGDLISAPSTKCAYLQILCSYGAIGTAVFLGLGIAVILGTIRSKSATGYGIALPSLLFLLVTGLADEPYLNPYRTVGNRVLGFVVGILVLSLKEIDD